MNIPQVNREEGGDLTDVEPEFSSWDDFAAADAFAGKVAVLSEPTSGPTSDAARAAFEKKFGAGSWHTWSPLNRDAELAGSRLAFGKALRPQYDTANAKVIACFDCDFLEMCLRDRSRSEPASAAVSDKLVFTGAADSGTMRAYSAIARKFDAYAGLVDRGGSGRLRIGARSESLPLHTSPSDTASRRPCV